MRDLYPNRDSYRSRNSRQSRRERQEHAKRTIPFLEHLKSFPLPERLQNGRETDKLNYRCKLAGAWNGPTCSRPQALVGRLIQRRRETVNKSDARLRGILRLLSWTQNRHRPTSWRHNNYSILGPWKRPYRAPFLAELRRPQAEFSRWCQTQGHTKSTAGRGKERLNGSELCSGARAREFGRPPPPNCDVRSTDDERLRRFCSEVMPDDLVVGEYVRILSPDLSRIVGGGTLIEQAGDDWLIDCVDTVDCMPVRQLRRPKVTTPPLVEGDRTTATTSRMSLLRAPDVTTPSIYSTRSEFS